MAIFPRAHRHGAKDSQSAQLCHRVQVVTPHTEAPFGRTAELERVERFLATAPPAVLVLEGDAGIGKTRVWEEGVHMAARAGHRVLATRASSSELQLSFVGLGDLLGEVLEECLPPLSRAQRRALEAALLLGDVGETIVDAHAVSLAFLSVLRLIATSAPLVLAIDDLQWLDASSGATLRFGLRRLRTEPVRLLTTVRGTPDAGLPLELERVFEGGRLQRVLLGPLSLGALHELLRSRLQLNLPRPGLVRLAEACHGNPFFALEIGREVQRRGVRLAPGDPLPIPGTLKQLIGERIARLPARTQRLLLMAAAQPLSTPEVLVAASADAAQGEEDVDRAIRAGVVEVEGGRLRFTHPLLAAMTYADASLPDRRTAHRALARVTADAQERARHLALAATRPNAEVASELELAAAEARRRGAPDAAAELGDHSVRLTPIDRAEDRHRRTLMAAEYRFLAGDTTRSRRLIEELLGSLPPGPARARALVQLAGILGDAEGSEAAVATCERALAEPTEDPALKAEAHLRLATYADLDNRRRAAHAKQAIELIEAAKDPDQALLSSALVAFALGEYYLGRGLRREALERAIELETATRRPRAAWTASSVFGQLLKYTDDYDAARLRLEAAHRLALDEGDESSLPDLAAHLSELELWTGDWVAAERYARESLAIADRTEQGLWRAYALYGCALVDAHLGRVALARSFAREGLALGRSRRDLWLEGICLWVMGFLDLSTGDLEAVERHLSRADEIAEAINLVEPGQWRFHSDRIEALIQSGRLEAAEDLLDRYQRRARATKRSHALAAAARCRGLLATARGDLDGALGAFGSSLGQYERLPLPFERARTLLALGSAERHANRKRAARETLERALETFVGLGAPLWEAKTRSELGRIGGRRAPARGALSETEAKIAELAASGLTNNEIAARLVASPKTVKWNLSKVYRKLGVRSRTELAAELLASSGPATPGPAIK
jgi:DNA-binding CsgD family transcriptional regulator